MAYTNTDFAVFQQMRRINPFKYHNQKTRKTMNTTYRNMGMADLFGVDEGDLTPVTEAESAMDLPELILTASERLEAGDLLFNELTDTTLSCLYATGGLPLHRAAANRDTRKTFAAMICTMWSDNIQLAVDHNASTSLNKYGIFQSLSMAEAQNIIEWVGATTEANHPVYAIFISWGHWLHRASAPTCWAGLTIWFRLASCTVHNKAKPMRLLRHLS